MKIKHMLVTLIAFKAFVCAAAAPLYCDTFDQNLSNWIVEKEAGGTVSLVEGHLDINVEKGATVWFRHRLNAPVRITYRATLMDAGGPNDRVSDLNCFWMATDPAHPENLFANSSRGGAFKNYNRLQLYYVGDGGGNNTTTRFRRYPGTGKRPMLPEHDLKGNGYTLPANQTLSIEIIAENGRTQYLRDGVVLFDVTDEQPFLSGWFGFRTLTSHICIDDFKVQSLSPAADATER